MKCFASIIFILLAHTGTAQLRFANFSAIDWRVESIDAFTPDSLAHKLTSGYTSELEKVRAIFSWTAKNISYNTGIYSYSRNVKSSKFSFDPLDTISVWKSANEMTALRVLHRRVAVCDGYAKLFKTLCDYAGIRSEIVSGYAKCHVERADKFRTNHSWNAVMIDSAWYLVDVTWASGYVNFANEFVQKTDETYFLAEPGRFIYDHYPDDHRWSLLERTPTLREFQFTPYKCKNYIKYRLLLTSHSKGIIEAAVGDTVRIELYAKDPLRDRTISADPNFDSTVFTESPGSAFLEPVADGHKMMYQFIVGGNETEWLHLMYNGDIVLRYRLKIKRASPAG